MKRTFVISENKVVESDGGNPDVLLYINPDSDEKKFLVENFKLDEHTLNSSLDPDELSRLEFEPEHLAVIIKRPKNYSGKDILFFKVASMGIFLFDDKIIIVLSDDINIFEGKQFNKLNSLKDLTLKIINRSIIHFLEHLKIFSMITDELEKKINTSMGNKYLINLFTLEKSLVYYLNAINSNSLVFEKLKNYSSKIGFATEEIEFLDDLVIENTQCYRQADIYSSILASMMDARASIVSNNINLLMKTLNIITIGIMVPTLVVSIFSMNVGIPLQGHPYAFWFIIAFALVSVLAVIFVWKKLKW
ncbi:MAG: magnesium transporter CorA family protein [Ignavibacteria bacterium]|jgi:magnesium transporter|nr:magnesium transporter CorA family protein [Ignavibacteria bacterium]